MFVIPPSIPHQQPEEPEPAEVLDALSRWCIVYICNCAYVKDSMKRRLKTKSAKTGQENTTEGFSLNLSQPFEP